MASRNILIEQLLRRGIQLKDMYSIYRMLRLKLRFGGRVRLASPSLGLERGSVVLVEKLSSITFGHMVYVRKGTDLEVRGSGTIYIGDRTFFGKNCMIVAREEIRIGSNCLFGEDVSIYDHNHRHSLEAISFREQGFDCKPIKIGNNVWVAAKAFISAGVTIGDNVVVGAGAIITKDVPSNMLVFTRVATEMRPLNAGKAT
jgi:acetyltransferase-like isoleucine patch superfamily enzyme